MRNSKRTKADWDKLVRENRDLKNSLSAATQTVCDRSKQLDDALEEVRRMRVWEENATILINGLKNNLEKTANFGGVLATELNLANVRQREAIAERDEARSRVARSVTLLELLREAEPLVARFETAVSKHVPDCLLNRIREALA